MSKNNEFGFSKTTKTNICLEESVADNPYVCEKQYLSGYNTLDLVTQKGFVDVLLLLFKLELPDPDDRKLLESLMIGMINPGPRHPATKAAMSVGISKANAEHILPISLSVVGGARGGAGEVSQAYSYIKDNSLNDIETLSPVYDLDTEDRFAPGFGRTFGQNDAYVTSLANTLRENCKTGDYFNWSMELSERLSSNSAGILDIGLAAAVFCDLDLGVRESAALYQFLRAPGLLAHGLEQTHRPINDIPLLEDSHYVYSNSK